MVEDQAAQASLVRLKIHGVVQDRNTDALIVVLCNERTTEVLPIWVGTAEGNAIKFALEGVEPQRPMSHDLIRGFADHLNIKVSRVVVTDVKSNTYYATVYLDARGVERTVDARPSDAIALALRTRSPIYATREVLRQRGGWNLDSWLERFETRSSEQSEA